MSIFGNSKTSCYTYSRWRVFHEELRNGWGVYINGAPQGITFHETDNFTLYPASIISINNNRFTKHYFIGDKRVASRIGTGLFNNVYGRNGSYVTAGQQDYAERMNQIQTQKEAYGDPENTGVGYNAVLTELGNHDVPQGGFRLHIQTRYQAPTPVLQSHGMTQPTLMTHRLVTDTSLMIPQKKKPSSITVTTSAVRLTSQTTTPT